MDKKVFSANIPVELEFRDEMLSAVAEVLAGEYESWSFGEELTVLDIGANVGSFTIWANMRWPCSRIHAYEPHPETFRMLTRNVAGLSNIVCHNVAVYPCERERDLFWTRYPGDGESGLVTYMAETFENLLQGSIFEVPILHPRDLPQCDVIKVDVEGAETAILKNMNLEQVSLILLEYQNKENRDSIKELLSSDFTLVHEDSMRWDDLLPNLKYKECLRGNYYGRMFFRNSNANKLKSLSPPPRLSLRHLLSALPKAAKNALWWRVKKLLY